MPAANIREAAIVIPSLEDPIFCTMMLKLYLKWSGRTLKNWHHQRVTVLRCQKDNLPAGKRVERFHRGRMRKIKATVESVVKLSWKIEKFRKHSENLFNFNSMLILWFLLKFVVSQIIIDVLSRCYRLVLYTWYKNRSGYVRYQVEWFGFNQGYVLDLEIINIESARRWWLSANSLIE